MKLFENITIDNASNKQNTINIMYKQLTDSIKIAFDSCSTTTTIKEFTKKKWFTYELKNIKHLPLQ